MSYPAWARWQAIDPDGWRVVFEARPRAVRRTEEIKAPHWLARSDTLYQSLERCAVPADWRATLQRITGQLRLI